MQRRYWTSIRCAISASLTLTWIYQKIRVTECYVLIKTSLFCFSRYCWVWDWDLLRVSYVCVCLFQKESSVHQLQDSLAQRESNVSALEEELKQMREQTEQQKSTVSFPSLLDTPLLLLLLLFFLMI